MVSNLPTPLLLLSPCAMVVIPCPGSSDCRLPLLLSIAGCILLNLSRPQTQEERDLARQRWEELPLPDALPFFEALETDAGGNLWVRAFQAPNEETRTWLVLSPDGTWLGSLAMPDRYGPLAIGRNALLARYADELDVEHVQLRELVRASD